MLNVTTIAGRLTADPESRFTNNEIPVVNFCLACERDFKDESGQKTTDFFNVVAWRKLAEIVSQYTKKGDLVVVSGRLQSRKYQTKEGESRTAIEVIAETVQLTGGGKKTGSPSGENQEHIPPVDEDSDLPF